MIEEGQLSAWIALFFGLYSFFAAIGELREAGSWHRMVRELELSVSLRFLTGAFCVALGTTIYLVNPWNPHDWLSILITTIGGLIVIKGLLLLALGDIVLPAVRRYFGFKNYVLEIAALVVGLALVAVAVIRI